MVWFSTEMLISYSIYSATNSDNVYGNLKCETWKNESVFYYNIHHKDTTSFKVKISSTMLHKFERMMEKVSHCKWISTGWKRQVWPRYKRGWDTGIQQIILSYCSNTESFCKPLHTWHQHSLPWSSCTAYNHSNVNADQKLPESQTSAVLQISTQTAMVIWSYPKLIQ